MESGGDDSAGAVWAVDIYLFDQILRGNISPEMRVLDAGCGGGRNIQFLLRQGYEVFGVDVDTEAVAAVRKMASELAPGLLAENFQVAGVEAMPFADEFADVVVCHSVLHFARDEAERRFIRHPDGIPKSSSFRYAVIRPEPVKAHLPIYS